MDLKTWFIFLISFIGWGLGAFISKLSTNKIGEKNSFLGCNCLFFGSINL